MKKQQQIQNLTIRCDKEGCGWSKEIDDINELYEGYPCPICNSVVITENDMKHIKITKRLIKLDNIVRKLCFWRKPKERSAIHIETNRSENALNGEVEITETTEIQISDIEKGTVAYEDETKKTYTVEKPIAQSEHTD